MDREPQQQYFSIAFAIHDVLYSNFATFGRFRMVRTKTVYLYTVYQTYQETSPIDSPFQYTKALFCCWSAVLLVNAIEKREEVPTDVYTDQNSITIPLLSD